jgi:hypothetical protein
VNTIDRLLENYRRQVSLPWAKGVSGKQRVWFAVYPPSEERRIRARLPQFEQASLEAKHGWIEVALTDLLPNWLAAHEYREAIFSEPEHFTAGSDIEALAAKRVLAACSREEADDGCVVALTGLSTLFDLIRVSSLVENIEDGIRGRLLVLFPGEFAGNVYRFMDARDGFNYMAVPITSIESFVKS